MLERTAGRLARDLVRVNGFDPRCKSCQPASISLRALRARAKIRFATGLSTQEDLEYLEAWAALGIDPNTGENVDNGVSGTEATRYLTERIKARGARV